jgi:hypothetical protein
MKRPDGMNQRRENSTNGGSEPKPRRLRRLKCRMRRVRKTIESQTAREWNVLTFFDERRNLILEERCAKISSKEVSKNHLKAIEKSKHSIRITNSVHGFTHLRHTFLVLYNPHMLVVFRSHGWTIIVGTTSSTTISIWNVIKIQQEVILYC